MGGLISRDCLGSYRELLKRYGALLSFEGPLNSAAQNWCRPLEKTCVAKWESVPLACLITSYLLPSHLLFFTFSVTIHLCSPPSSFFEKTGNSSITEAVGTFNTWVWKDCCSASKPKASHKKFFGFQQPFIVVEQTCRSSSGVGELRALLEVSKDVCGNVTESWRTVEGLFICFISNGLNLGAFTE